jgi:hypothetical protein
MLQRILILKNIKNQNINDMHCKARQLLSVPSMHNLNRLCNTAVPHPILPLHNNKALAPGVAAGHKKTPHHLTTPWSLPPQL